MKKSQKNGVRFAVAALGAMLAVFAGVSCSDNVGLGDSVDTEAPKIEITYPPTNAVIKGSFIVAGSASDDKGVTAVTITVQQTGSDEPVYEGSATIASDSSWQVTLNDYDETNEAYNGWQFADGTYEVSAVAQDAAGRTSGTASSIFTIDNTAPVLVLTNPTSVGTQTAGTFGQTVQLKGSFSETSNNGIIRMITVTFYDTDGAVTGESSFTNVASDMTTEPLAIAQYYESDARESLSTDDAQKWENYKLLFKDYESYEEGDSPDSQQSYFTVTAYDSALSYTTVGDSGTGSGNSTTSYYRGTTDMLQLIKGSYSDFSGFGISSLRGYLNGTDTTYSADSEKQALLESILTAATSVSRLESDGDIPATELSNTDTQSGTANVWLTFTVNPSNNPKYSISGYAINAESTSDSYSTTDYGEAGYKKYYLDNPLNATFSLGLDETKLDTSTVSLYVVDTSVVARTAASEETLGSSGTYSENKILVWTWNEAVAVSYAAKKTLTTDDSDYATYLALVDENPSDYRYTKTSSTENSESLSLEGFTVTEDDVSLQKTYYFYVEGADIEGQNIVATASGGYGIWPTVTAEAPLIEWGEEVQAEKTNLAEGTTMGGAYLTDSSAPLSFSGTVTSSVTLDASTPMTYTVTLTSASDASNKATLNGVPTYSTASASTYAWNFTVTPSSDMTTMLADAGRFSLVVQVTAKNGGGTTTDKRTYVIDTKAPVVTGLALSNATAGTATIGGESATVYYINPDYASQKGYTYTLSGSSTDNYELSSTSYVFTGVDSTGAEKTVSGTIALTSEWTAAVDLTDFAAQDDAADVTLSVTALDSAGNESSAATLLLEIDATAPAVAADSIGGTAYTSDSGTVWQKSTSLGVEGTIIEAGSGVKAVYYQIVPADGDADAMTGGIDGNFATAKTGTLYTTTADDGTISFTSTLSGFAAGENALRYVLVDNAGNASEAFVRTVSIDTQAPSISEVEEGSFTATKTVASAAGKTFTFIASDGTNGSGIVTASSGSTAPTVTIGDWTISQTATTLGTLSFTEPADDGSVTGTVTLKAALDDESAMTDGKFFPVYASVYDEAGNVTTTTIGILSRDSTSPVVSVAQASGTAVYAASETTLTATVSDTSGIAAVAWSVFAYAENADYSTETALLSGSADAATSTSFTVDFGAKDDDGEDIFADGTQYVVCVSATDTVGNTSTYSADASTGHSPLSAAYTIDRTGPVLSDGDLVGTSNGSGSGTTWVNAAAVSVSGVWTDAGVGASMLYYQVTIVGTDESGAEVEQDSDGNTLVAMTAENYANTYTGVIALTAGTAGYKYSTNIEVSTGTNRLRYVALDSLGNVSELVLRTVQVDIDAPTVSSSTITETVSAADKLTLPEITIEDSASGIDTTTTARLPRITLDSYTVTYGDTYEETDARYGSAIAYEATTKDETTNVDTAGTFTITLSASLLAKLKDAGTYALNATLYDNAGNSGTATLGTITMDLTAPAVTVTKVSGTASYVNGETTVNATIKEANSIASIDWAVFASGTTDYTGTPLLSGSVSDDALSITPAITVDFGDSSTFTDGASYVVCVKAKDDAENESTFADGVSSAYTIDRTAPSFGSSESGATATAIGSKRSSDLYASEWFKETSLSVAGSWTEEGSGIEKVYYQVIAADDTDTTAMTNTNYATAATGSFSTTDKGSYENFSTSISGFASQSGNTLRLVAVDYVGNASGVQSFTINVDQNAPTVSAATSGSSESGYDYSLTGITVASASSGNVPLYFVTTDGTSESGVDSIALKISSYTITLSDIVSGTPTLTLSDSTNAADSTISYDTDSGAVSVSLSATLLSNIESGYYPVSVTVTDKALMATTESVRTLNVDKTAPTVKISSPTSGSVNKTITVSGTANDTNGVASVTVWANAASGASATDTGSVSGTNVSIDSTTGEWTATLDTTALYSGTETLTIYIHVAATDSVGNTSTPSTTAGSIATVTVNQNADRPVVKVTNLSTNEASEYVLKYGTNAQLSGSLTDDDSTSSAVATAFYVSGSAFTFTDGALDTSALSGTTEFDASTGEWTYTPADTGDGSKSVYFYVEDTQGGVFYTTNTESELSRPYFQYQTTATDNAAAITYRSDSTSPTVTGASAFSYAASATSANETDASGLSLSIVLGGTEKQYAQFVITASDANGIAGMTFSLSGDGLTTVQRATTASSIAGVAIDSGYTVSTSDLNSFTATTNSTTATWTTEKIDLAAATGTSLTLTIAVYDNCGLAGNGSYTFSVDNLTPSLSNISPSSTEEVTGTVTLTGSAIDTGNAGLESIQYVIPTIAQQEAYTASATRASADIWSDSSEALSVWSFKFNGTNEQLLTSYDVVYDSTADGTSASASKDTSYATSVSDGGVYTIPVWIKATDTLGNYIVQEHTFLHNPEADKPSVVFTYPTEDDYDTDSSANSLGYITLGGTIRATGTATIPSGTTTVKNIYVQIADADAEFDSTDKETVADTYGLTVVDAYTALNAVLGTAYTTDTEFTTAELKAYGFASNDAAAAWWGVAATGTASWNIALNSDGKMNPASSSDETNNITIRACGINAEGKFGAWTSGENQLAIHIDNAVPSVLSEAVNQYSDSITSSTTLSALTTSASQTYASDMYLRGQWYLRIVIVDESGIDTLSVSDTTSGTLTSGTGYFTESYTDDSTNKKGYIVLIPVSTANEGSITYTVIATDTDSGNPHTTTQTYAFNIDNTAPTLTDLTGNDATLDSSSVVQNSNYVYTIGGSSTDTGSGFERVAFYFMRKYGTTSMASTTDANDVVIDPMVYSSTADTKVAMSDLTELTITQDDSSYTLYAYSDTGSATESVYTASASLGDHVREGGLIYIDGLYRRISAISGNEVTFEPSLSEESSSITAYFPIAQVVDNTSSETVSSRSVKPMTFKSGDDGDLMPESVSKSGTTWTWDASIQSDNMPDGPVTLVILAFDSAGNVNGTSINTIVSNNAPRIAKLYLATDLNSNSTFEENEFATYNLIEKEGEAQSSYTLNFSEFGTDYGAGVFTAKNKLAVVPELTGGNGDIALVVSKGAGSVDAVTSAAGTQIASIASTTATGTDATALTASGSSTYSISAAHFAAAESGNTFNAFVVENYVLAGAASDDAITEDSDGDEKPFSFTFWDSTEETTVATDSQNAVILVNDFSLDLVDGTAPKSVINPFYWVSASSNSLYENSAANGHIELEADLTSDITSALGSNPKVSGKITFTGTSYDEHALGAIAFTFGTASTTYLSGTIATYDSSTAVWTAGTGTIASNGWSATITSDETDSVGVFGDSVYFGQKGHKVYWTLSIDTETISDVAVTDAVLTITATDLAGNTYDESAVEPTYSSTTATYIPGSTANDAVTRTVTDGTTNVPVYQMDVVPYIAGVKTSLSSLKKANSSVYDRTALGHYPTSASDSVYIYGFNLSGGDLCDSASNSSTLTKATASEQSWYSTSSSGTTANFFATSTNTAVYTADVSSFTSGNVYVQVGGISSLNNMNSNAAAGAYTGTTTSTTGDSTVYANYYNRQPNGDSNNLLTDDVVLDVWYFNSEAAKPISGVISDPVMKINPDSGMIGFAFTNGPLYFSMPGTVSSATNNRIASGENSYAYWQGSYDFMSSVGFAYDSAGYTYGVAAGGDINATQADRFSLMTDRWGISGAATGGSYGGTNALRLEAIAQYGDSSLSDTGTLNFDKNRIKSPSIATSRKNTTSSTNIYMAYFDDLNEEIRFRYGNLADSQTTKANFNNFYDAYRNNTIKNTDNLNYGKYSLSYCQVIADSSGSSTLGQAGEYVAIDVVQKSGGGDVVVLVWYDSYAGNLMYAYNTNPTAATTGKNTTNWSTAQVIFTDAGEYCQLAADANGGIHIAGYDSSNGDLKYAYLSSYSADYSEDTGSCTVDSYAIIGQNITIDVALNSSEVAVPYIGYYGLSSTKPKIAYKVAADIADGAEDDVYTSNWEVSIVPTASKVPQDRINVAVWKDSSTGVIKASTDGTTSAGTYFGTCYGNTTANPVLGYQIRESSTSGYIETAQMQ